jgi:molecular chaperone DnaK (HSP70)
MMFELSGVPFMQAGEPRIAASFDVDHNGILTLDVTDTSSGGRNEVAPLVNMRRLSTAQIEDCVTAEAAMYAADEAHRIRVTAREELGRYADAVRQAIRAPLDAVRMSEEEEVEILEAREAAEVGLQTAAEYLAVFPLLEMEAYQTALSELQRQTSRILPLSEAKRKEAAGASAADVESLVDGLPSDHGAAI